MSLMRSNSNSSNSNCSINPISTSSTCSSTKGNGNAQACAACKYQRRKCAPDCILAPFFPHDRQRQFLNAHKLFGVSNITKTIKQLDPTLKEEAMRTIIFQSDVRASDPVGGCYRIIRELQRMIEYNKAELDLVLHQLAICRAQAHQQVQQQQQQQHIQIPDVGVGDNSCDIINVDPLSLYNAPMGHYHYLQQSHAQQQEQPYVFVQSNNGGNDNNNHHGHLQQEDVNMWAMQDSMSSLHIKHGGISASDCEDMKPFVEINDPNRCCDQRNDQFKFHQPHQEIGDHHQQSEEGLLKADNASLREDHQQGELAAQQAHHHLQDHDHLKGEASLFMTLTNCTS